MNTIYEPKGRAREYSPLALNVYRGCDHGCVYCYVPGVTHTTREAHRKVMPRVGLVEALQKHLKKTEDLIIPQVLLCFTCDPYCKFDVEARQTREVLKLLLECRVPTAILTKGGERCLRDLDLFGQFNEAGVPLKVGASLVFAGSVHTEKYEPGTAWPYYRLDVLEILHKVGIHTWASFEPVIIPEHSLSMIKETVAGNYVDEYKLGRANYTTLDHGVDYEAYLIEAVGMLRDAGKPFYAKRDLAVFAEPGFLTLRETDADRLCLTPRPPLGADSAQGKLL